MAHIQNVWLTDELTSPQFRIDCCGCSACEQVCGQSAIVMRSDKEQFLYPVVDERKCVDCGLCLNVCPVTNKCDSNAPYLKTFAGYSTDEATIKCSTSGGFATTLSRLVIDKGGIVYGVKFTDDYTHTCYATACTHEDLKAFASSKYIQADKQDVYRRVKSDLAENRCVLFVGCPCDVAALKRYIRKDYDNLLTCELVCMGVTSPKVAIDYKAWTERKNHSKLIGMNMRSKSKGWFVPHLEEHFENGKTKCSTLFGTYIGYGFQIFNRPSCFSCQYRDTTGVGDIRVGDFWGIKETDEFWNPNGVSGIYVRTQKGLDVVKELTKCKFSLFETDYMLATRSNMSSYMNKPQKYQILRDKFAKIYVDKEKGLVAACHSVASFSFWIKHYVPDSFHVTLKKIYHIIKDKKRKV